MGAEPLTLPLVALVEPQSLTPREPHAFHPGLRTLESAPPWVACRARPGRSRLGKARARGWMEAPGRGRRVRASNR